MTYLTRTLGHDKGRAIWKCYRKGFIWADQGVAFMDNFFRNMDLYTR